MPSCELKGHIDEENVLSYSHGMSARGRGFGIVRVGINVEDCEGGRGTVDGDVYVADMHHEPFELGQVSGLPCGHVVCCNISSPVFVAVCCCLLLFQKLMRVPNWVESALKEAYATGDSDDDDDVDEDEEEEQKNKEGDDGGEPKKGKKGALLGSGAMQARRALKNVFQTKAFRTAVSKTYERYYTEGTGMEKKHLLQAVRHFFYKVRLQ